VLERYLQELQDESKPVRHQDLVRLARLTPEEVEAVCRVWTRLSPERRRLVVQRVVHLAEEKAELDFTAFLRICLKDPDPEVRAEAVEGLWESEERSLITPLIHLLRGDPSEQVRASAAKVLGQFALRAAEGRLLARDAERVRTALMEALHAPDESPEVRRRALEAVAPLDLPEVHSAIETAYRSPDPKMRQSALYAMGRTANPRWLPTVLEELNNPDPAIRYEAVQACGHLGDEDTVPRLLPLLRDPDLQVRLAVIRSLGALGGALARRALAQCLRSPSPAIREAAQAALEEAEFQEDPLGLRFPLGGP